MNHFCTYCDKGYAARLLCLHDSLAASGEPFALHVLCFGAEVEAAVRKEGKSSLRAVSLDELLEAAPDYAAVRGDRSPIEFFFTTTPVFTRFCFERNPDAGRMTYLDADLYFFGPTSAVFAEQADASVAIVPHRFPPHLKERERYGMFNVAWVSFRRDEDGLACLEWWRARCLEWCRDELDGTRFADQGYLNDFPRLFRGVTAIFHPGVNAAPWNMAGVRLGLDAAARSQVNGRPLLFYHFQGIREIAPGWFEPGLRQYGTPLTKELRELVYRPYLRALLARQEWLRSAVGIQPGFLHRRLNGGDSWRHRWERFKAERILPLRGRLTGRLIHAGK